MLVPMEPPVPPQQHSAANFVGFEPLAWPMISNGRVKEHASRSTDAPSRRVATILSMDRACPTQAQLSGTAATMEF
jgi:hypothetical protein